MELLDRDLPERGWFNLVLGVLVLIVLGYLVLANYRQYQLVMQMRKEICGEECVSRLLLSRENRSETLRLDMMTRPVAVQDSAKLETEPVKKITPLAGGVKKSTPFEAVVALSGGRVESVVWQSINGEKFAFGLSLYPEGSKATFEGWVEVQEGANKAYLRLYDVTNSRAVDGSEVVVAARGRASFYSSGLSIWRGSNQYRVEAYSDTGYPVSVSEAKIRVKKM